VRVVRGEASYFGHVDGIDEASLIEVADSVAQAVRGDERRPRGLGAVRMAEGHPVAERPEEVDPKRKAELLRVCDERARAAGLEVTQVSVGYAEERRLVEVFNSDGVVRRRRPHADPACGAGGGRRDAASGTRVQTGTDTRGGHAGFELLSDDPGAVGESAARKALTLLDAVEAPSGRMAVVVGNGFGGALLHEAVGHGLEADAVHKRASVYAGKLGQQLAEPSVTAYDDGRRTGEWGSDGIDDEGTPTRRTTVIENGRLTSYLYVTDVAGLHSGVNPVSGTFSVGASGRLIEGANWARP